MSTPSNTPETDAVTDKAYNFLNDGDIDAVSAEFARSLEIDRDKLRQQIELLLQVRERDKAKVESDSIVASCDCNVKTNDPQQHAKGCKYRLICERDTAREKIDAISKRAEAIRCELVASEKQLTEKDAQIVALRKLVQHVDNGAQQDVDGVNWYDVRRQALSTPPPAVVPLEDVRPLVAHLRDMVEHIDECDERQLLACDSDPHPPSVFHVYGKSAEKALSTFTAKHPL